MLKKVISVLLSVVLAFSLSANVFAAGSLVGNIKELADEVITNVETTKESIGEIAKLSGKLAFKLQPVVMDFVLDAENWEKAGKVMMDVIVKIYDKIIPGDPEQPPVDPDQPPVDPEQPPVDPEEPDVPDVPQVPGILDAIKELTIEDWMNLIRTYFFININDIPETSTDIIEMAEYTYVLTEDGKETVFIAVNIEKHPELLNRDLLMEATEKLYEEQKRLYPNVPEENLMSYDHIAGELALHAVLYAASNEYLKLTGATEGTIFNLWERSRIADLNITENRVPVEIIQIMGTYIMGVFILDIYTIVKIFNNW